MAMFTGLRDAIAVPLRALAESHKELGRRALAWVLSKFTQDESGVYAPRAGVMEVPAPAQRVDGSVDRDRTVCIPVPELGLVPIPNLNVDQAEMVFAVELSTAIDPHGQPMSLHGHPRPARGVRRKTDQRGRVEVRLKVRMAAPGEGARRLNGRHLGLGPLRAP